MKDNAYVQPLFTTQYIFEALMSESYKNLGGKLLQDPLCMKLMDVNN